MVARSLSAPPVVEPISDINTTPLIDVLLVLLIMFIITIPLQNHAVKLDLPGDGPVLVPDQVRNKIVVTEQGALLFNGASVSSSQLAAVLERIAQLPAEPELQLQPAAGAPYGKVNEVLVLARKSALTRIGFVGNEQYRHF